MANEIDLHHCRFEFTSGFRTHATTEQKKMIGDSKLAHSTTVSTAANSVPDSNPPLAEPQDLLFKTRAMRKSKATDSGLRGVELVGALHTLIELRNVLLREQRQGEEAEARGGEGTGSEGVGADEVDEGLTTGFVLEKLGDLPSVLEAKVEGPCASNSAAPESQHPIPHKSRSPSLMPPSKFWDKLNVVPEDDPVERGNHIARTVETAARGGGEYMSSKNMYSHLNLLQILVLRTVSIVFQHRVSPLKYRRRTGQTPAFG